MLLALVVLLDVSPCFLLFLLGLELTKVSCSIPESSCESFTWCILVI